MSERSIRVNELILRELSHVLRTRFRDQSVAITLTEVSVSPDLRNARIYYSVIGDERAKIKARSFFTKEYRNLQRMVSQVIVLKYFPKMNFIEDDSIARGNRVLDLIQSIDDGPLADDYAAEYGAEAAGDEAEGSEAGDGYVFDEDDLEYARDIEGDEAAAYEDEDDDGFEDFDEASDVEINGDIDAYLSKSKSEDDDADDEDGDELDEEGEDGDEDDDDFDDDEDDDSFDDDDDDDKPAR